MLHCRGDFDCARSFMISNFTEHAENVEASMTSVNSVQHQINEISTIVIPLYPPFLQDYIP